MKRYYPFLLVVLLAACNKEPVQNSAPTVSKSVTFNVAQGGDYSASYFNDLQAELRLTVSKEGYNGSSLIVWDTSFAWQNVRQYPAAASPLIFTKEFKDINETKEALRVSKVIRYTNSKNEMSMNASGEDVLQNVFFTNVQVRL